MNGKRELSFRKAVEADRERLLEWANEEEARRQSFQTHRITLEEHERWFQNALQNENIEILIACLREKPVGSMRFLIDGTSAALSYSIDYRYRGRGFGKKLIELAVDYAQERLGLRSLSAETKPDNIASQKVLLENGFSLVERFSGGERFTFAKELTSAAF